MSLLTPQQQRELMAVIERGELPDPSFKDILFPFGKREVSLEYADKTRREDVIGNTLSVPLQQMRCFNGECDEAQWHNALIWGDNLQAMRKLLDWKREGRLRNADGSAGVRLIYIDPPFATKQEFRGNQDQKAYADKIAGAKFIEAMRRRLVMMHELLSDDGSLYLHLDTKKVHYLKVVLDEIFGEENFQNEIIWRNTSIHSKATTFGEIHQTILMYSKNPKPYFQKLKRPHFKGYIESNFRYGKEDDKHASSDLTASGTRNGESGKTWNGYDPTNAGRHWAIPKFVYELVDDDIEEFSTLEKLDYLFECGLIFMPERGSQPRLKRYLDEEGGNFIQDLWAYQPYTKGIYADSKEGIDQDVTYAISKAEKTIYPTQKPEGLLNRIIAASTNPGDIVLDAFVGSGTTCAVAEKLGRRWIGIDAGKLALYTAQKRLLSLKRNIGNKGKALEAQPFALYNAGHYDFTQLSQLDREKWRFFALELFQCSHEPHSIKGLQCDGKKGLHSVLVFDHHSEPDTLIDEDFVETLHSRVGNNVGNRFYIIAKRASFDFQEDYLDFDGVRYYALRIPYSFIEELHKTKFSTMRQPVADGLLNDLQEAVGFDFIDVPDVGWEAGCQQLIGSTIPDAVLDTTRFVSHAKTRNGPLINGLEALAMMLIDFNYSPKVFAFDRAFHGAELQNASPPGRVRWPLHQTGENVAVIWIDIHGNESFQVIAGSEFEQIVSDSDEVTL